MTQKLSQEYIDRVREIFDVFDIEAQGEDEMGIEHLGTVIRAFGQIPTEAEVQEIVDEVDADGNRKLLFPELLDLLASLPPNERGSKEELAQALEIFKEREDKRDGGPNVGGAIGSGCTTGEDGHISTAKLRKMLTLHGEQITDDMLNLLLSQFPENASGMIKTKDLMDVILDQTIKYTSEWLSSHEGLDIVTD